MLHFYTGNLWQMLRHRYYKHQSRPQSISLFGRYLFGAAIFSELPFFFNASNILAKLTIALGVWCRCHEYSRWFVVHFALHHLPLMPFIFPSKVDKQFFVASKRFSRKMLFSFIKPHTLPPNLCSRGFIRFH